MMYFNKQRLAILCFKVGVDISSSPTYRYLGELSLANKNIKEVGIRPIKIYSHNFKAIEVEEDFNKKKLAKGWVESYFWEPATLRWAQQWFKI